MKRAIWLALLLSGCSAFEPAPPPDYNAIDDSQCRSFGAKPGTDIYTNCRMQLASQREGEMAQRRTLATQYLLNHMQ